MKTETPIAVATDEVIGVDLGIAIPVMDSRGSQYGSDHWKGVEDRTFEVYRYASMLGHSLNAASTQSRKLSNSS